MLNVKKIYLYAVSLIALVIMVIGAITLLNLGLKTFIFTKADRDFYAMECFSTKPTAPGESTPKCSAEEEAAMNKRNEENRAAQKQRDAAQSLAMLIVAAPVFYFHWRLARKEA